MDNEQFRAKLADTRRQLAETSQALDTALRALGITAGERAVNVSQSFDGVLRGLTAAMGSVVELDRLFGDTAVPVAATRACTECGKRVMIAATLCGYCWSKLTAVTD